MTKAEKIEAVAAHYKEQRTPDKKRLYHPGWRLKPRERRHIEARLAEGYSVEELCLAIDAMHRDEWNLGLHPKTEGRKNLGLHLALGEEKIDRRMEQAEEHSHQEASRRDAARREAEQRQAEEERRASRPEVTVSSRELLRQHMRELQN